MDAADNLIMLGQQARMIQHIATDRKARKLAGQAVQRATAGLMAHNTGDFTSASMHMGDAASLLSASAKLHVGTLESETPSASLMDAAHLGSAHQLHQDYVTAINEGKNNGR
jgi:hypothetical protein